MPLRFAKFDICTAEWVACAAMVVALSSATADPPEKSQSASSADAARLVRQLGSGMFEEREEASKRLKTLGVAAVEPVAKAAESGDLEVAIRAITILSQIAVSEDAAASGAAVAELKKLTRSANDSVAVRANRAEMFVQHWAMLAIESLGGRVSTQQGSDGRSIVQLKLGGWKEGRLTHFQRRALKTFSVLVVTGGDVTNDDVAVLEDLTDLSHLDVRYTRISDAGLSHFRRMTQLRKLYLSGTDVSDSGLKTLNHMPELRTLYLSGTKIGDGGIVHVARLKQLEELNLSQCKTITDAGIELLKSQRQLKQLNLTGTGITDEGLQHLARLEKLEGLYLHGTNVTEAGIGRLRTALPKCKIRH